MTARISHSPQTDSAHHTESEWIRKFWQCGAICFYCGEPLTLETAEKEHMVPICRKGADTIDNIVPACKPCNRKKGWRTVDEFREVRPAFFHKPQISQGINPYIEKEKAGSATSVSEENRPALLRTLLAERETVSWMWRNPV